MSVEFALCWKDSVRGELEIRCSDANSLASVHEALLKDEFASHFRKFTISHERREVWLTPEERKGFK